MAVDLHHRLWPISSTFLLKLPYLRLQEEPQSRIPVVADLFWYDAVLGYLILPVLAEDLGWNLAFYYCRNYVEVEVGNVLVILILWLLWDCVLCLVFIPDMEPPNKLRVFPGGSDGRESACKAGDLGLIPGLGRHPGGGKGSPPQYSCQYSSTEEPGGLQFMGLHRVRHDWTTNSAHHRYLASWFCLNCIQLLAAAYLFF